MCSTERPPDEYSLLALIIKSFLDSVIQIMYVIPGSHLLLPGHSLINSSQGISKLSELKNETDFEM